MRVTVRLFAILKERAGTNSIEIELAESAIVADALEVLAGRPELAATLERTGVVMAVNLDYADPSSRLHAGDELALIPPVSGGSLGVHVRVGDEPLSLEQLAGLVARPTSGATVVFQGSTRDTDALDYEAYTEMAERRIREILEACLERHRLQAIAAEHRVGRVPLGQASVIVATSSAHREEAFAGAREAIDRIKSEVPIWKREVNGGTERWADGVLP